MSPPTPARHLSDEQLSAHLDGETGETGETGKHLDACNPCSERLAQMGAARRLAATPVATLDERARTDLVSNAMAAAQAAVPAEARRRRGSSPLVARVAAVALVLGLGTGIAFAVRAGQQTSPSATAGASATVNGQQAATAAAQKKALAAEQAAEKASSARRADLLLRPVITIKPAGCSAAHVPPAGDVTVALPAGKMHGASCLVVGPAIVTGLRPSQTSIQPGARGDVDVSLAITTAQAEVLERAGVQLQTGTSRPDPGVDPPVSTWRVVALAGTTVLGEVSAVRGAGASPTYFGLVVAVDPVVAERLAGS